MSFIILGIGDPHPDFRSLQRIGIGDMLDECDEVFSRRTPGKRKRMTVHESLSLESQMLENLPLSTNCLGEDRVIVSDVAGTTRDAIDTNDYT